MKTLVWVYPERTREPFGARRYLVSWEQVKKSSTRKEQIDPDSDVDYLHLDFRDKEKAIYKAQEIIASGKSCYGEVTVTKQVIDWFVEEDRIAEWIVTSEKEYIS